MSLLKLLSANTAPSPDFKEAAAGPSAPETPRVRLIAFYLPQFHPIPENDLWWGPGFTEWSNVTRALPRFEGHLQPRLPADLGFYDLRDPDVLRRQAALARRYGIEAFCFHQYWFHGRRLLQRPLELLLENPDIDIKFCINWANENWTRRWDGLDQEVLVPQSHDPEDDEAFARSLVPAMRDPRYLTVDGRPLLMMYRPGLLPNSVATVRRWRTQLAIEGLPNPYVVMAQSFGEHDPRLHGMEAAVEFPPHGLAVQLPDVTSRLQMLDPDFAGVTVSYDEVRQRAKASPEPPYRRFRGVCPSWDNEPRKPGRGFSMVGATPQKYGAWLEGACRSAMAAENPDERIVFVNAWNEWAEGAYLEPDRHYGHANLVETARVLHALEAAPAVATPAPDRAGLARIALLSHDAYPHGAQFIALALARTLVREKPVQLKILLGGPGALEDAFRAVAETEMIPAGFADLEAWRGLAKRLRAEGYVAVISNTTVAAQALRPLREAGLRVVQLVHELPSLIRQYKLEAAAKDAAVSADALVFPSAYVRDRYTEVTGPISARTELLHQGLYTEVLSCERRAAERSRKRAELGIGPDQPVVLGVGYGDVRKGLDLWASLVRKVVESCPDIVFVWAGRIDPNLEHWLSHDLAMAGLETHMRLPGHITEMASLYACADLYALTSREDPFPSVAIEAMAYGLPIVLFENGGGIAELVTSLGGAAVPYLDLDKMAGEITRLLNDPSSSRRMGERFRRAIDQEFSYSDYAASLFDLAVPDWPRRSVSVVVPNYNYARYLRGRLESIWAQTVQPLEIILLDDASTDGSALEIERLERESPIPLRVVRNSENSGAVARQWARGVAMARGDLVWIAEADDLCAPSFLATLSAKFTDPKVVVAFCQSSMIDEQGKEIAPNYLDYVRDVDPGLWTHDYQRSGESEIAEALAVKNTIPNASAALFRREVLARVMAEHAERMAELRNVADWYCYIHVLERGMLAFVAEPLNQHRRHSTSVTISASDRRHVEEIRAMQELASRVVPVRPGIAESASRYHRRVAEEFGVALEGMA